MNGTARLRHVLRAATLAAAFALVPATVAQAQQPGGFGGPQLDTSVQPQYETAPPGQQMAIAVTIGHGEGLHSWPNEDAVVIPPELGEGFIPIPTVIEVVPESLPPGVQVWETQYPEPEMVTVNYTGLPTQLVSFAGDATAYVPVSLPLDMDPGDLAIEVAVGFQACDETVCYPPENRRLTAQLAVTEPGAAPSEASPALFAAFAPPFTTAPVLGGAGAVGGACEPVTTNLFALEFSFNPCGAGLLLLLFVALLGGMMLNLTPCVLPVIPIKILGLSHAAGDPRRMRLLGISMSVGVVAFWLLIGAAIAFVAGFTAISSLFQTGWFSLAVGLFVGVMALGMFGLFATTLPQWVYRINPSQETLQGSFLFGVLTAILSTPCTAPFMGAASAWAATQAPAITLATFAAIGVGMALPYLVLSFRPGLVERVPRSGPASELVKQTMGLLMLAVAAYFIGVAVAAMTVSPPQPASRAYWYVVAFFVVAAMAWLIWRTWRISDSTKVRALVSVPAAVLALGMVYITGGLASHGPIDWVYYTPEEFAAAQAANQVVVLDFTAEWCLNCKTLEAAVLHQPEIVELLESDGVVPMKVDLTDANANPNGSAKLQELQAVAIPLLAVFGPGLGYEAGDAVKWDNYTVDMVREAVSEAGGQVSAN